jgi:hypothetical protein
MDYATHLTVVAGLQRPERRGGAALRLSLHVDAQSRSCCREDAIKVSEFATVFHDQGIRSWFDWEFLRSPDYSVTEIFSRSAQVLGSLETVWYVQPDGSPGDWRGRGNRRLRVEEAALRDDFPDSKSYGYIQELAAGMRKGRAPYHLLLPCYRTERGRLLILDGNHRAVAAFKSDIDSRLLIFAITGPDNPFMLPDLLHEKNYDADPEAWERLRAEIEEKFRSTEQPPVH